MAEMNRKNLVLRGVRVVNDVVTGMKRAGCNPAGERTAAMSHSPQRPHGERLTLRPRTCLGSADSGTAQAGSRAGRLERCAGSPNRRLAITARPAILSRWSRYSWSYPLQQGGQQWSLPCRKRGQARSAFTGRFAECMRRSGEPGAC